MANQTWTAAGSPYLVQGDITIPAGGQLTIEPGTVIQMASTDAQVAGLDTSRVEITVKGTLNINGSGAAPAIFEAQTGTAPNTWYGIVIQDSTSSATIHFAVIRHAVFGIAALSGSPTIDAVTATQNDTGIVAASGATPIITNVNTYANDKGISVRDSALPMIVNCTIYGNGGGITFVSSWQSAPASDRCAQYDHHQQRRGASRRLLSR